MIDLHDFFESARMAFGNLKNPGYFQGVTIGNGRVRFLSINSSRRLITSLWRKTDEVRGGATFHNFHESAEQAFKDHCLPGVMKGVALERGNVYFISIVDLSLKKTIWREAAAEWREVCQSLEDIGRHSCLSE